MGNSKFYITNTGRRVDLNDLNKSDIINLNEQELSELLLYMEEKREDIKAEIKIQNRAKY